jgi:class 3 adenylate cyclase
VEWPPEVRYARSADGTHIGYAVVSTGTPDILLALGLGTNLGLDINEEPGVLRWYERLAGIGRFVVYDQRGAGVSDPVALNDLPTVERVAEDMEAVLDAVGSQRAVIIAMTSLGPAAMVLAATKPQRVASLVLYGTYARLRAAADYPMGMPDDVLDGFVEFSQQAWGTGEMLALIGPSRANDPAYRAEFSRFEKLSISPRQSAILGRMGIEADVRGVLASITVPTLVVHRRGDRFVDVAHGRYLAEHIPNATLFEVDGEDHAYFMGSIDPILDRIEEFITGELTRAVSTRVLTTVLFTDIVRSTETVAEIGDKRWREILDHHDRTARRQVERFGGKLIQKTGDGLMATFDGPARAVLCAGAIRDAVKVLGLDTRAGVHTGEVELRGEDLGGIAVHIAARIAGEAGAGEVWASRTVRDLTTGSGIEFSPEGPRRLKGVNEPWELYQVSG